MHLRAINFFLTVLTQMRKYLLITIFETCISRLRLFEIVIPRSLTCFTNISAGIGSRKTGVDFNKFSSLLLIQWNLLSYSDSQLHPKHGLGFRGFTFNIPKDRQVIYVCPTLGKFLTNINNNNQMEIKVVPTRFLEKSTIYREEVIENIFVFYNLRSI